MLKHTKIPAGKGIRILHSPGGTRFAPTSLLGEGLLRFEEHGILVVGIHDGYTKYLKPLFMAAAQPDQNQSIPGVFFPDLDMKQGSMSIAMRCPFVGSRKDLLNESQSNDFLKF